MLGRVRQSDGLGNGIRIGAQNVKIGAMIPAKLTSTRLERKNVLPLDGKPLFCWSVQCALESGVFSDVTVSSESDEVLDGVREYFAENEVHCLKRPDGMSEVFSPLKDVIRHYLQKTPGLDYMALFMPTYPFRNPTRIRNEIAPHLFTGRLVKVISLGCRTIATLDYWIECENGYTTMFSGNEMHCRYLNSAYTFFSVDYFMKKPAMGLHERVLRVNCFEPEDMDIDTAEDYEMAKKIVRHGPPAYRRLVQHQIGDFTVVLPQGVDFEGFLAFAGPGFLNSGCPLLILRPADILFTALDINDPGERRTMAKPETNRIWQSISNDHHSQLYPPHYLQNGFYRIILKSPKAAKTYTGPRRGKWGKYGLEVPGANVIMERDLEKWSGYVAPYLWPDKQAVL